MNLRKLTKVSLARANRWHAPNGLEDWSVLEWAGAMAGEAGEAANFAKKIKRIDSNITNRKNGRKQSPLKRAVLVEKFQKECADTVLYGILAIMRTGGDPVEVIRNVFNNKSAEYGFPERI